MLLSGVVLEKMIFMDERLYWLMIGCFVSVIVIGGVMKI